MTSALLAEKRCCPWFDKLTMRLKSLKTRDLILSLSKDEARFQAPSAARATWLPAAKAAPKRWAPLENVRSLRGACERGRKPGHIYARIVPSASRGPEPPAIRVAVNAAPEPKGRTIVRPIRGMPLVRQFLRLSRRIDHGGGDHRQGSCERC
jgi:hypothetical protein